MTKDKEDNANIFRKMRLPVIVKPFILNNQSMCSFTIEATWAGYFSNS